MQYEVCMNNETTLLESPTNTQINTKVADFSGLKTDNITESSKPQKDGARKSSNSNPGVDSQGIFAERFELFMRPLSESCDKEEAVTAVAIVVDSKNPNRPLVFIHGREYDAALLITSLLRELRKQIADKLSP